RLADETQQRFLVWCGVDLRLPVQFHVGYGDSDVDLHRCNPLLLTPLLRAIEPTGVPVMLLHNYPYQREAGYLAQVFSHVYVDAGLATHNLGARAPALLAEALELAPFGKFLYSSDAFGLPELYYLGAALFRTALSAFLRSGLEEDIYTERTAAGLRRGSPPRPGSGAAAGSPGPGWRSCRHADPGRPGSALRPPGPPATCGRRGRRSAGRVRAAAG